MSHESLEFVTLKPFTEGEENPGIAMGQRRLLAQVMKHETRSFALLYAYRS